MATMRDVARRVGLSVTTVSRALNGYDDVADETREEIRRAARELDYHPNAVARSLRNSRANAIGLVIPAFLHRVSDVFWLEFIGGMASVCARRREDLVLSAGDASDGLDDGFRRLARGRRIDGVLLCDIRRSDPRITYLQQHRLPFVAFGRTLDAHDYSYIDVDGATGVQRAIEYLIGLGHRRIAYLDVDPIFSFSHFRMRGYREALARAQLPIEESLIVEGLTAADAPMAVGALLARSRPPTAIFASADFLAVAALKAARALGLEVPGDLSIAVFDDNFTTQHTDPPLTAVSQPNRHLGEEAATLLLDRVANAAAPVVQRLIVPGLVPRQSTAPPALPLASAATG